MEQHRRRATTVEQLNILIGYLEQHRDLALGRVRSKEARAVSSRLWNECSLLLNSEGPARTSKEWAKVWNDLKCRVRAKLVSINASHQATGGGPSTSTPMTPLEDRIASILGRDMGPLPNVRQDPLAYQNYTDENTPGAEPIENILGPIDDIQVELAAHEASGSAGPQRSVVAPEDVSPSPSLTGYAPLSPGSTRDRSRLRRERQRAQRAAARPVARTARVTLSPPPPPAQSNRNALDESRAMVLKIEKLRAEAAVINAEASKTMAEGFKSLADSIDRLTRQYAEKQGSTPDQS